MDIRQYQPSPKVLQLADMFCTFFGKQPVYYSFDLGNRVIPVNYMKEMYPITGAQDLVGYRSLAERMATSHYVQQLVTVVEETLRCFPEVSYNTEECCGLVAGLCGGRTLSILVNGVSYRCIVLTAGVVWLDKVPQVVLDPDSRHWITLAKTVEHNRNHILRERALLKNLFR